MKILPLKTQAELLSIRGIRPIRTPFLETISFSRVNVMSTRISPAYVRSRRRQSCGVTRLATMLPSLTVGGLIYTLLYSSHQLAEGTLTRLLAWTILRISVSMKWLKESICSLTRPFTLRKADTRLSLCLNFCNTAFSLSIFEISRPHVVCGYETTTLNRLIWP